MSKKIIEKFIIALLILTIPSCFSKNLISDNEYKETTANPEIYKVETNDGLIFTSSNTTKLSKLKIGIVVENENGKKIYKHEDIKSVTVYKIDALKTALLTVSCGVAAFIIVLGYTFSQIKM